MAKPRSSLLLLASFCVLGGCDGCAPEPEAGPLCGREIHVSVHQRGADPAALEEVLQPLEDGLRLVDGIGTVESQIGPNDAVITLSVASDATAAQVRPSIEGTVNRHPLPDGAVLEVRSELRVSRSVTFVEDAEAEDLGHPTIVLTAIGPMMEAVGLDLRTMAARVRDGLGDTPPSIEALQGLRLEGLTLDSLVNIERADGPRIEGVDGAPAFLRVGPGDGVTLNDCDAAPPVENMVRARINPQEDDLSFDERRAMAAALMAMARDAGHTPYLLLDIDLGAALSGRPATRDGVTEVVVMGDALELARAWRSRELPGAALTVDASDVRRLRVSVEEAQSGAVLARLATSPDVAELLPSPRARGRMTARVDADAAARAGQSVEALERLAADSLEGLEVVPGLTLMGPPLDTIHVGAEGEEPGVPLSDLLVLNRTFDAPISRADGRRVRQFEARVLLETDREALLNQVLGR